jgi:CubicO group peptidase (beta-lactamase class C family)
VTGAAATAATAGTAVGSDAPLPPKQRARLRAAVGTALRIAASPAAVVAVQTPRGRWVRAFGIANEPSRARMRTDVHQRIGSVTKTFTGALLMQLVGEGRLSLDGTIDKYVGGVPNGDTITPRQLADMTSGVASYTANSAFTEALFAHAKRRWKPREVLDLGLAVPPDSICGPARCWFPPGTACGYSNTTFILLGMVIRQVARKPIGAVLRERIIAPLIQRDRLARWFVGAARAPRPRLHAAGPVIRQAGRLYELECLGGVDGRGAHLDRRRPARVRPSNRDGQGSCCRESSSGNGWIRLTPASRPSARHCRTASGS